MINSRSIDDLSPEAQSKYAEFEQAMTKAGLRYLVTSTYRDQECQNYLYASGRTRPGPILTHLIVSPHQSRVAWDIALYDGNRKPSWDIKMDVNKNSVADYLEAARIGSSLGLIVGGLYHGTFKDYPHFNLPMKPWDKE